MTTKPGKDLERHILAAARERDANQRARLLTAALNAARALDAHARDLFQRSEEMAVIPKWLQKQGFDQILLDGAPDLVLEMWTAPTGAESD
jgi:hypothetical protein